MEEVGRPTWRARLAVAAQAALVAASLVLAGGAVLTVFMAGEPRGSVWGGLALSAFLSACMFLVAFIVFAALKAGGPPPLGRGARFAPFLGAALIGVLPFAIAASDPDAPTAAAIVTVSTLASLGGALFWKSDLARRTLPPVGVALAIAGLVFAWSWTKPDSAELAQFREDMRRAGFANCIDYGDEAQALAIADAHEAFGLDRQDSYSADLARKLQNAETRALWKATADGSGDGTLASILPRLCLDQPMTIELSAGRHELALQGDDDEGASFGRGDIFGYSTDERPLAITGAGRDKTVLAIAGDRLTVGSQDRLASLTMEVNVDGEKNALRLEGAAELSDVTLNAAGEGKAAIVAFASQDGAPKISNIAVNAPRRTGIYFGGTDGSAGMTADTLSIARSEQFAVLADSGSVTLRNLRTSGTKGGVWPYGTARMTVDGGSIAVARNIAITDDEARLTLSNLSFSSRETFYCIEARGKSTVTIASSNMSGCLKDGYYDVLAKDEASLTARNNFGLRQADVEGQDNARISVLEYGAAPGFGRGSGYRDLPSDYRAYVNASLDFQAERTRYFIKGLTDVSVCAMPGTEGAFNVSAGRGFLGGTVAVLEVLTGRDSGRRERAREYWQQQTKCITDLLAKESQGYARLAGMAAYRSCKPLRKAVKNYRDWYRKEVWWALPLAVKDSSLSVRQRSDIFKNNAKRAIGRLDPGLCRVR